ncbi:MAG: hypothetical protein ACM3U2_06510, partial [Deltaproteobacteria bacterium]
RSFDYAAYGALFGLVSSRGRTTGAVRPEDRPALVPWMRAWRVWTHNAFLQGYLEVCADESFVPRDAEERNVLFDVQHDLEAEMYRLPPNLADMASQVRHFQVPLLKEIHAVVGCRIHATRIRCHGDCHLHQVLFTGKDFVFIDFEGRPGQSIGERRIKRSPLVDVISMIRSFDYAAYGALFGLVSSRGRTTGAVRPEDRPALVPWMRAWRVWTHNAFLQGYLEVCADESFVSRDAEERNVLYRVLLLDKLLLELARELRSRSAWLEIPLLGLLEAVQPPEA